MSTAPAEDFLPDEPPVTTGKKKRMDDELDITPMIDITFLLLIFFVVTSKMQPEQVTDLPRARNGDGVASKQWIVINVERGTGENALVTKKDGTAFSADKETQATEIAEYVRNGIEKEGMKYVVIRAEGSARTGEVSRVREAISEGLDEGQEINIAVQEQ